MSEFCEWCKGQVPCGICGIEKERENQMSERFTKFNIKFLETAPTYQKRVLTRAVRIDGPFSTETREGIITCSDGYLAMDSQGFPYPIAKDEFETIYMRVGFEENKNATKRD